MAYRVSDDVARRTSGPSKEPKNPSDYEAHIYQRGLEFERTQFTFQTDKLQQEVGCFLGLIQDVWHGWEFLDY